MKDQDESKPNTASDASPYDATLKRAQQALDRSRRLPGSVSENESDQQALSASPEAIARRARSKEFEEKLHRNVIAILDRQAERLSLAQDTGSEKNEGTPKKAELTKREKKLWDVIRRGARGLRYCGEVDNEGIRIRTTGSWKGAPSTYAAAYRVGEPWRHRIQDEKSKITRKAKLAKTRQALAGE